jgi:hypothetical protein
MSIAAKPLLSVTYLRECFDYDPETGVLRWKVRPEAHFPDLRAWKIWNTRYAGRVVKCAHNKGYIRVSVDSRRYLAHRVIWAVFAGSWPVKEIDHRNEDKTDNHWHNLREATSAENRCNRCAQRNNTTGFKGVRWSKNKSTYIAHITHRYQWHYLGAFSTAEEAHAAYCTAADQLHGKFANHGR